MQKSILLSSCLFLSLAASNASAQTAQWWDNNGASAATSGTWDTITPNWASSATLTASTVAFADDNFPIFTAGSAAISALTVTVPGAVICEGFGDGTTDVGVASGAAVATLTFSGAGSINLPTGTWAFECGNSSPTPTITINVPITGPGGFVQHNSGTLQLYGINTYSGGTTMTGGQLLYYNNSASFGMGPITNSGTMSILNGAAGVVTLPNAFYINNAGGVFNFASGNTICSGPWTLLTTPQIKDNNAANPLTISGAISSVGGAFGLDLQNDNSTAVGSGTITLSGPNTYTGPTSIGAGAVGGITTLSVTSINSVTTPAQQSSSSLGVPSSVANGTIAIGATSYGCALIYTGSGETSDRVINLSGTTGAATIEMNGTGPLILTSPVTVTTAGARTLTLEGTSTAANSIGAIPNSSSGATTLTKAQAGTWVLSGVNTFSGNTTISAGTLTIGGAGKLNSGSYAGNITDNGTFIYGSSSAQTLSGTISGSGTLTQAGSGTLTLSGANTYSGNTTNSAGILQVDHADTAGTSGPLGKATAAGSIVMSGGTLQYVAVNAAHDYSSRFSTAAGQAYNIDVNGQPVTFGTALSSSTGTLTLLSTAAGGVLTLNAAETYTGATTITSGTLAIGTSGSLDGGNYAASIIDNGTFTYSGTGAQTLAGAISGTGSLIQQGAGSLTLTATAAYTGATTIGANSDLIFSTGNSSPFPGLTSLSIAAGGTLDVSQCGTPYVFNSTSYSFTGTATAAATINGAPSGLINLGSAPMSLTISPTTFTGDTTQPALVIAQASLTLSGNVIAVNNASGTPLGAGNYVLIQPANGTSGTPSQYVTVTGNGLVDGDYATVQISGGNVALSVQQPPNSGPTWNGNDYANFQTWSDSGNWASGVPDATGDQIYFANTSGPQTPVMNSSYSVYSLTFLGGCSSDVLTASGGSSLTVGSGVTNSSGTLQILALPVQLVDLGDTTVPSQWNASGGNITASGVISDNDIGLAVSGGNTLTLSGLNTYTGGTTINSGATVSANTIADANCSIGPSGALTLSGGTLAYTGATGATTTRAVKATAGVTSSIDVPPSVSLALNSSVTGTATSFINKTDGGTLMLGGTTDNSGLLMNINGGTVIITKSSTATAHGLGGGTSTVGTGTAGNSAELQLAGSGSYDLYSQCILTVNSPDGFVDLNGQNDSFSTLTLSGAGPNGNGVLINSATGTTSLITNGGSAVVLAAPTTIGGSGNINLYGKIATGTSPLTYAGTGTLTLASDTTWSGGVTINSGGSVLIASGGTTATGSGAGVGPITINGNGVLILSMGNSELPNMVTGVSTSVIDINLSTGNLWLTNNLGGFPGTFNVNYTAPGGQLVVGNGSTYATAINSSATWNVAVGAVLDFNGLQTDPATVVLNGLANPPNTSAANGALRVDGGSLQSGPVILMGNSSIGNGITGGAGTISGVMSSPSGSYGFTKVGADPITLTGLNTYTGNTGVSVGTLTIGSSGDLGDLGGANTGTGSYAGTISITSTSTGAFTYASSAPQTLSGVISGAGSLTQSGASTLILSGANTYTGGTTVNNASGTLDVNSTGSILGNVTVTTGTLELDSTTTLAATATLNVAASGATVNLTYGGNQTIASLFIGGVQQAPGVYGASAYNPGGIFTGPGTLTITTGGGSSPVSISSATISGGQLVISWSSVAGGSYNVYTTPSLNPPATWTLVNSSPIPSQGTTTTFTVPGAVSGNLFVTVQQ